MKSIPLVRQAAIAPAISYLASDGVPVQKYLQAANLAAPPCGCLETLVPLYQVCDFLNSVASGEGIDDLGFRIGGCQGTECLGMYGRLLAQALTIHETIQISTAIVSSYNSGLRVWAEYHGDLVRYCHQYVGDLPRGRTAEIEHLALAVDLNNAGCGDGASWKPTRIDLATDPIDLTKYFPGLADVPMYFNQPFTSVWAHKSILSDPLHPLDVADRPGVDEYERQSYKNSAPAAEPIGQLEQTIESNLDRCDMSLQLTAAIIGTSPRTLQRHLAQDNTSFSRTLQAVRFRNAQSLLQDSKTPLTVIAKRLGYTDSANFIRAFKRWTGVAPSEFRRLHYKDGFESD